MMIGEAGDLRQVGDAQDLAARRKSFEAAAESLGGTPADAGIDFIEDQGAGPAPPRGGRAG